MKKLLIFSILYLCVSAGYAFSNANTKPILDNHKLDDQKSQKTEKEKKTKYDFSLFKFITPKTENSKSDTLKIEQKIPKQKRLNSDLSELYEKSRSFLMLS